MLTVTGLVTVPNDPQLREVKTNSGYYLNFNLGLSEVAKRGNEEIVIHHKYQASMWVPDKDLVQWKEKLVPGNVFLITAGKLASEVREKDGRETSFTSLKLNCNEFKKLKRIQGD